jgi:hypothetical protein
MYRKEFEWREEYADFQNRRGDVCKGIEITLGVVETGADWGVDFLASMSGSFGTGYSRFYGASKSALAEFATNGINYNSMYNAGKSAVINVGIDEALGWGLGKTGFKGPGNVDMGKWKVGDFAYYGLPEGLINHDTIADVSFNAAKALGKTAGNAASGAFLKSTAKSGITTTPKAWGWFDTFKNG